MFDKEDVLSVSGEFGVVNQIEFQGRSFAGESVAEYHVVNTNDVVYTKSPLKANPYGIIKTNKGVPGIVSTLYAVYHSKECTDPLYVEYYFGNDLRLNKFLKPLVNIGAKHDMKVNNEFVLTGEVCFPSVIEQQKVVQFLSCLDQRIEKQRCLVEHLKKYKRGLLSSLLGKEEWQTVLLQDVACGFDYGMNSAATEYDGKHKYIRITDIDESTHKYISTECVSPSDIPEAKYKVEENDILFARTGASVGKSYIYDSCDGDLYYAGFLIRASVKPNFNSYFVYLNTLTLDYQRWVILESTRSGQPGINAEQYRNYRFKCPSIEIQNRIAEMFNSFDSKLHKEQEILDHLLNYKKGLLQKIFV